MKRLSLCLLLACSPTQASYFEAPAPTDDSSWDSEAGVPTSPPSTDCMDLLCVDGRFTGWSNLALTRVGDSPRSWEWSSIPRLTGKFTYMYMQGVQANDGGTRLYFLNDWHRNKQGAIADRCYNRFNFFNQATKEALEIRVFGNQTISVLRDGKPSFEQAKGAAGFYASPNIVQPHSIFEFYIDFAPSEAQAQWMMAASDPCGSQPPPPPPPPEPNAPPTFGTECEDPSYLLDEPMMAAVAIGSGSVSVTPTPEMAFVYAVDKFEASPGQHIVASGRSFGAQPGSVTVGGVSAVVDTWTSNRIRFVVPENVTGVVPTRFAIGATTVDGPVLTISSTVH